MEMEFLETTTLNL